MTQRIEAGTPRRQSETVRSIGHERIDDTIAPLDALLATEDIFLASVDAIEELRVRHLRDAVTRSCERDTAYARYCDSVGFKLESIQSESDLWKIPLLPTGVFKRQGVIPRTSSSSTVIDTTSSGTQGTVSVVPRDDTTLMRFFSSVAIGKRDICGVESFDRQIFNLGPTTNDAPNLWLAYVMAGVAVIYTTHNYVERDYFDISRLLSDLRQFTKNSEGVTVSGPPPLILDVARVLEERGEQLSLGDGALVLATGGWKRRQGEMISRSEFDGRVAKAFGIRDVGCVRDTYNMVELNTVLFECSHKTKHVPPWLWVSARDPRTLVELESGAAGLLAFADPTPTSYPGFVLSDDFGLVSRRVSCPCGITSDTLSIDRRVNKVETRGCALKLETSLRNEQR